MKLTENDGNVVVRAHQLVLHLIGNLWDFRVSLLVHQPAQQLFLFHQISLVHVRNAALEQDLKMAVVKL